MPPLQPPLPCGNGLSRASRDEPRDSVRHDGPSRGAERHLGGAATRAGGEATEHVAGWATIPSNDAWRVEARLPTTTTSARQHAFPAARDLRRRAATARPSIASFKPEIVGVNLAST